MSNRPLSLVFMGTPAFAVPTLAALHASGHNVTAVYTQPPRPAGRGQKETPSPVHAWAEAHGLHVFTPATLKPAEAQAQFAAHGADAGVVAAYGLLLPPAILGACPLGCINIHPSLLPRWRGAAPIQRTLMAGDATTGVCIMQMDAGLDTGDVLLREEYPIPPHINAGALHDVLSALGAKLTLEALAGLATGTLTPRKQAEEGVTYAAKFSKEDGRIAWQRGALEIHNHIRALSPTPGAWFTYGGEAIKILRAQPGSGGGAPGTVLDAALTIACGSAGITPLEVQRPGKKRMSTAEMLAGFSIPPGSVVG